MEFIILVSGLIVLLYIGWINSSIREIKQKLSNIEELLKTKNDIDTEPPE